MHPILKKLLAAIAAPSAARMKLSLRCSLALPVSQIRFEAFPAMTLSSACASPTPSKRAPRNVLSFCGHLKENYWP
jgi:hypothetical protein